MVEEYPSAIFGKLAGASAYTIIEQHATFESPEFASAFQRICNSFEWKPNSSGLQHRPCHGVRRVGDGLMLARFRDAGRDTAGRPHTLRIECLIARPDGFQSAWKSLTHGEPSPPLPDGEELVIIGDPETFWSAVE